MKLLLFRVLPITILVVVISLIFLFVYSRGRVSIDLPVDGDKTVEIYNENSEIISTTSDSNYSAVLSSGFYTVLVSSSEKSYVELIKVGRFFGATNVNATELNEELGREFIGDEPRSCRIYSQNRLVSYTCGGSVKSMALHRSANASTPTYTTRVLSDLNDVNSSELQINSLSTDIIQGHYTSNGKVYILVKSTTQLIALNTSFILYELDIDKNSAELVFQKVIEGLDTSKNYQLTDHGDSISLVSNDGIVLIGENLDALTRREYTEDPPDTGGFTVSVDSRLLSADYPTEDSGDLEQVIVRSTELTLLDQEKVYSRNFDELVSDVDFCGLQVCGIVDDTLIILDGELNTVAEMSGVAGYSSDNMSLLAFSDGGVVQLNLNTLSGSSIYSSGYLDVSGASYLSGGPFVVVTSDNKNHGMVLQQTENKPDVLLEPLFSSPFISTVSIYRDYIFAVSEIGSPIYNEKNCQTNYDEDIRLQALNSFNSYLDSSGIKKMGYRVSADKIFTKPATRNICTSRIDQTVRQTDGLFD